MRFADIRAGKEPPEGHTPATPARGSGDGETKNMATGRRARRGYRTSRGMEQLSRSRVQRLTRKRRTGGVQ